MNKEQTITITDPVLKGAVTITVNRPFPSLQKFLNKYKHPTEKSFADLSENGEGLMIPVKTHSGRLGFVIWIKTFDWSVRSMAILTHEILHYVIHMMEEKQIPVRIENEETLAYVLEHYQASAFWKLRQFSPRYKGKRKK